MLKVSQSICAPGLKAAALASPALRNRLSDEPAVGAKYFRAGPETCPAGAPRSH